MEVIVYRVHAPKLYFHALGVLLAVSVLMPRDALATTALLNVTGAQSGSTYYTNDTFVLTVSGAVNSPITVSINGGTPVSDGMTNGSGQKVFTGGWTSANVGSYTEVWYVNGVAASPLSFTVAQTPTPTVTLSVTGTQTGSTYYVFDTFKLTLTGAPKGPITVSTNGAAAVSDGTMPSSGTMSFSGQWLASNIGKYSQVWSVNGVAAPAKTFTVDGPVHTVVQDDETVLCSSLPSSEGGYPGCPDLVRAVTYLVFNFSGSSADSIPICEKVNVANWSCTNIGAPSGNINSCNAAAPNGNGSTSNVGIFTDGWYLTGNYSTSTTQPCGFGTDTDLWEYPLVGSGTGASATVAPFMYLTGSLLNSSITINGNTASTLYSCTTSGCGMVGWEIGPSGTISK